ncbi:hypothetical protein ACVISU_006700 [Bradyrhizobium sp. USDA 4452]
MTWKPQSISLSAVASTPTSVSSPVSRCRLITPAAVAGDQNPPTASRRACRGSGQVERSARARERDPPYPSKALDRHRAPAFVVPPPHARISTSCSGRNEVGENTPLKSRCRDVTVTMLGGTRRTRASSTRCPRRTFAAYRRRHGSRCPRAAPAAVDLFSSLFGEARHRDGFSDAKSGSSRQTWRRISLTGRYRFSAEVEPITTISSRQRSRRHACCD